VSAPGPSAAPTATATTDATAEPATTAPTIAPATTTTPRGAATAAPVAAAALSEAALQKTLLTADELPGWTAGGPGGGGEDGDDFKPCGKSNDPKYPPTHEAMADYNQGQLGDQLQLDNESHPSASHAHLNIQEAKQQIKDCPTWTQTQDDGTKITFTAKPASFANIADETAAFRIEVVFSGTSGGQSYEVHGDGLAVGARVGQNIVGVFHMALGFNTHPELDTAKTGSIARKAVAKFKRTA
jgi:hypothetical protein